MFEFTSLFCTIDDFFQKNEAVYWQYLKQENPKVRTTWSAVAIVPFQVISLEFMHPYAHIKSAIRTSLNLQRCETRLIHDSGLTKNCIFINI